MTDTIHDHAPAVDNGHAFRPLLEAPPSGEQLANHGVIEGVVRLRAVDRDAGDQTLGPVVDAHRRRLTRP